MPIPTDYLEIIGSLIEKTNDGNVKWYKDEYRDVTVLIDTTRFALGAGSDDRTEIPFVTCSLFDVSGKPLDGWYVNEPDPDYARMHQFYKTAHRYAFDVPKRLKELNEFLAKTKTVGVPDEA